MNAVNQPENTTKTEVRDAAVQIGGEGEPTRVKRKSDLLIDGFCRQEKAASGVDADTSQLWCAFVLACIAIEGLTSSNKFARQQAKEDIRKAVKLGKGD